MPNRKWLEDFEAWAIRKGGPVGRREGQKNRPGLPMKPRTVQTQIGFLTRILVRTDPPFLEITGTNGNGKFKFAVTGNIRRIRPEQLAGGIDAIYPQGPVKEVAATHKKYVQAVVLLGRWLAYELQENGKYVWTEADIEHFRALCPTGIIEHPHLEVIEPERFDLFLDWLHDRSPEHWATITGMRLIGLRFSGMRGATRTLREKYPKNTFRVARGRWTIWEKKYHRSFDVPQHVQEFLEYWDGRLKELHPDTEWFFPNTLGTQWTHDSSSFNKVFRKLWAEWVESRGEDVDLDELEMVHAHMCRHICATDLATRPIPPSVIKEYMGHRDLRTTQLYINLVSSKEKTLVDQAFQGTSFGKVFLR